MTPSEPDRNFAGFMPIGVMLCIVGWEYTGFPALSWLASLFAVAKAWFM